MSKIWVIAKNTFQEAARDRVFYGLLAFAVIFILVDLFLAKLSLGDLVTIKSFGLAGIYIFGLIITIFLGSSIIYKEIERKTLYFVLSKPVSRAQLILGKFFGLFAAVKVTMAFMAIVYLGVIAHEGGGFDWRGLIAIVAQVFEMGLFVALLVFFSSIIRPLTSIICSLILLFTGHLLGIVMENMHTVTGIPGLLINALYYILPNLDKFDLRGIVVHALPIPGQMFMLMVIYALVYIALLIFAAIECFKRREF